MVFMPWIFLVVEVCGFSQCTGTKNRGVKKQLRATPLIVIQRTRTIFRMVRSVIFGMTLLAAIFGGVLVSRASGRKLELRAIAAPPVWRMNVTALGYTPPTYRELAPAQLPSPLCFIGSTRVSVTFVDRVPIDSLPRRGQVAPSLPLRLHALFIDVATGHVQATREWPSSSYASHVIASPLETFVVVTPDRLLKYTSGLQITKQLDLTVGSEAAKGTTTYYASPAGKYLLVSYEPRDEEQGPGLGAFIQALPKGLSPKKRVDKISEFLDANAKENKELIDLGGPHIICAWTDRGSERSLAVADDGTMMMSTKRNTLETRPLDGVQYVVCASLSQGCSINAKFVSNDALFSPWVNLGLGRYAIRLVSVDGRRIFEQELPEKQYVRYVATSAGQQRFAIAIDRGKGGSEFFDIAPHYSLYRILVYDIPTRGWVYALDAKKEGIKSISGLALSPDGTLMALINQDGILEVFRLPPEIDHSPATFAPQPGPQ